MAEEKGKKINMAEYEAAKKQAQVHKYLQRDKYYIRVLWLKVAFFLFVMV